MILFSFEYWCGCVYNPQMRISSVPQVWIPEILSFFRYHFIYLFSITDYHPEFQKRTLTEKKGKAETYQSKSLLKHIRKTHKEKREGKHNKKIEGIKMMTMANFSRRILKNKTMHSLSTTVSVCVYRNTNTHRYLLNVADLRKS